MANDFPIRTASLADQVYEIVLQGIADGTYPRGSMLPSENQLAERFNVSRPTIRAAFARLAERGYVTRRRGVGTLVAESPSIVNPLYQFIDIFERISSLGLVPGFEQISADIIPVNNSIGKILEVPVGSDVLNVHKVFTANDQPIIYFVNYIPRRVFGDCLTDEQAVEPGITEPFFTFYRELCNHPVTYLTSVIRPEICLDVQLAEILGLTSSTDILLYIEDIGFDKNDTPVFYSEEYLVKEASSLHVIRQVDKG